MPAALLKTVRLRKRVILISLLGVGSLTLFVQWSDMRIGGTMAAGPFPPLAACLQWGLLLLIHAAATRARKNRELLTRSELLVILAVWTTANMAAGRGLLHPLLTSLVGPTYYARSGLTLNAVNQNLPDWLAVRDKTAAAHFFEGYGVPVPWNVWRVPLLVWSLFFLPFLTANICLCALFEQVWIRNERLAFPLVSLPIQGLQWNDARLGGTGFHRAFAVGLAVPLLLHGFGAAHAYLPAIPCIPFYNEVSDLVSTPPWTAIRPLYFNFYPLLIGITFLAPADMSFSVWFFLALNKIELLMTAAAGWNEGASGGNAPTPPFLEEQSAGAYLVLGALLVWNARRHLQRIAASVWPSRKNDSLPRTDDAYRPLALGFLFGVVGILLWCVWSGLPLWFSAGFFGFYFIVALVLSRLMAESGVSWLLAPILPDKLLLSLAGSASVSQLALTRLTLHVQHLRDTRQMLAPSVFQAAKLRDEAGVSLRPFYALLFCAVVLALVVGVAAALPTFYHYGALSLTPNSDGLMMTANVMPTTGINQLSSRLLNPVRPSTQAATALFAGAIVTLCLAAMRTRFLWWPLNPLGYALTGTLQVGYANKMLLSIFLGWFFKALTLRLGGTKGFRLLRGAALGLILGDLLMGGILKLLDALLGPSGYAIF